jgi:hypothetical protein
MRRDERVIGADPAGKYFEAKPALARYYFSTIG